MPRPMQRSRPANRPGQTRGGRRGQLEAFERRAESRTATATRAAEAGPIELPLGRQRRDLASTLGVPVTQVIKTLFTNGTVATINQALDYDTAAVVATDLGFEVREQGSCQRRRWHRAALAPLLPRPADAVPPRPSAPVEEAGRSDRCSSRGRQWSRSWATSTTARPACWTHSQYARRGRRGGWHHPAHRRLPGRGQRQPDHLPRYAGPRGVHGHARAWRPGDRYRRHRRRRRRRRDATDARGHRPRPRRQRADHRCHQQDRPARRANPDRVKQELADLNVVVTEYGGNIEAIPVSARTHEGIDTCSRRSSWSPRLRSIPKANPNRPASGAVIEAKMDKTPRRGRHAAGAARHAARGRPRRRRRRPGSREGALRRSRSARQGRAAVVPGRGARTERRARRGRPFTRRRR